jgi:hypothetical protein
MLAGAAFPGHSVRLLKNERWQCLARKAREAFRFVSLGEGDSKIVSKNARTNAYQAVKARWLFNG